jgi:uncharacterized protein YndB with AHSA1/START domain
MKVETKPTKLEPIRRSVTVSWDADAAFRRFTSEIGRWWPLRTHSVSEGNSSTCVFEGHVGGRIYEVARDGAQHDWGKVLEWEPPRRVKFTWHPGREVSTAGWVELRFTPMAEGTRLDLTHGGWEHFGRGVEKARRGYRMGWGYVLELWAGRPRAPIVVFMNVLIALIGPFVKWRLRRQAAREPSPAQ